MNFLYLDIETMPDPERQHLWDIPEPQAARISPYDLLGNPAQEITTYLGKYKMSLGREYFEEIIDIESRLPKPRKSVLASANKNLAAEDDYINSLALDPELAKIVGLGTLVDGSEEPQAIICRGRNQEEAALSHFWRTLSEYSPIIVGFNVLKFDLRVIVTRSILLGVKPSRTIDFRKWGNPDIIDLMIVRFGTDRAKPLKILAKQYGIKVMAEGEDGSMVKDMDDERLTHYLASDLFVTRDLHHKFAGAYCPPVSRPIAESHFYSKPF